MTLVNHLPPERMTPEQRRLEIASLLAKGLLRVRLGPSSDRQMSPTTCELALGFSGDQSVHTDHVNK